MTSKHDYRLAHQAPTPDDGYGRPVRDALTRFGPDVLDHPDLYGAADDETVTQMRAAVYQPGSTLRVYRAVPLEHLEINQGDWVTLSRPYAHDHGYVDGANDWPVVYADVPANQVWTDGNDLSEYGYAGPHLKNLAPYAEGDPMPARPAPSDPETRTPTVTEVVDVRPSPGAEQERRSPMSLANPGQPRGITRGTS